MSKMILYSSYVNKSFPRFQFPHLFFFCGNALNNTLNKRSYVLQVIELALEVQRSKTEMCNLRALQHVSFLGLGTGSAQTETNMTLCGYNNCRGLPPKSGVEGIFKSNEKPDSWSVDIYIYITPVSCFCQWIYTRFSNNTPQRPITKLAAKQCGNAPMSTPSQCNFTGSGNLMLDSGWYHLGTLGLFPT